MTLSKRWLLLISGLLLAACSGGENPIPPQQWQNMEVELQSRPSPVQTGMNEFMVIATDQRGRPEPDFVVSLRVQGNEEWHQAMQDGRSGVYRKAIRIDANDTHVEVRLKPDDGSQDKKVLTFPVRSQSAGQAG